MGKAKSGKATSGNATKILVDGNVREHPAHAKKKARVNKLKGGKFQNLSRGDKDDLLFVLALDAGLIDETGNVKEIL